MTVIHNPDGSTSVLFDTWEPPREDQIGRAEVYRWAEETYLRQKADRIDVRRRAAESPDPAERARCREAIADTPPPSLEECLRFSRQTRRKREVDHRSTLLG